MQMRERESKTQQEREKAQKREGAWIGKGGAAKSVKTNRCNRLRDATSEEELYSERESRCV